MVSVAGDARLPLAGRSLDTTRNRAAPTVPTSRKIPPGGVALAAICYGTPLFFVAGAAGFVWVIPAVTTVVALARRRNLLLPKGTVALGLFLAWVALSVLSVSDVPTMFLFAYRYLIWVAMAAAMVWLINVPTQLLPSSRVVNWLASFWIILIGFGYVALLLPNVDLVSPLQRVLPESLLANDFLRDLTALRFTEYQRFLSYSFARPAAPMFYANGWGSTVGLLTPFFVQHWLLTGSRRHRTTGWVITAVGFVPIVLSLNRGLWLSLAVGLGYLAVLEARRGRVRLLGASLAVGVLAVGLVLVTPLGDPVQSRLDSTEDSNEDRTTAYEEAVRETLDSPLLGYAQPQAREGELPVGTHGLLWYVLFSHGFPAAILFSWWMARIAITTARAPTQIAVWSHVVVVMAVLQIFFYGLLPQVVLVGMAAGLSIREQLDARARRVDPGHRAPAWA